MKKIKEFILKGKNRNIVIGGIVLLIVLIIGIILISNNGSKEKISNSEIREIIDNKNSSVIYIYNSRSNNENGSKILKHLNDNRINFKTYDVSKIDGKEYVSMLDILNIDRDVFDYPAIIYVKDGVMFANIINVNDLDVVDRFIQDYELDINSWITD